MEEEKRTGVSLIALGQSAFAINQSIKICDQSVNQHLRSISQSTFAINQPINICDFSTKGIQTI
jgi:hypothetical protein